MNPVPHLSSSGPTAPPSPETQAQAAEQLLAQGQEALASGRYDAAGAAAELAIRLAPKRPAAWLLLADVLGRTRPGEVDKALTMALGHFGEGHPARSRFEAERALALARQGDWDAAAAEAARAASRPAIAAHAHRALAEAHALIGRHDLALKHAGAALAGLPEDASVNRTLAETCRALGRLDEAEAAYGRTLAADPDDAQAHAALARLRRWTPATSHVAALEAALGRAEPASVNAALLGYALFKELDDIGRPRDAWAALFKAAAAATAPFDEASEAARVEALIGAFPASRLTAPTAHAPAGPRPIFVFGLPRSGTTLVDRILSAHSTVASMGETFGLAQAVKTAARTATPGLLDIPTIRAAATASRADVARLYQQATAHLAGVSPVVTDKLPLNYEYVGVAKLAFPSGALVHVRRSPMDTLFGAYRLPFGAGAYSWSYRLSHLAAYYRLYRRLTDHWRQALGPAFIEVTLETLIADPEAEITRLLAACGLPFEAACLAPEVSAGAVSTESAAQVRSPINAEGVGAWKRYAAELEPLRARLEQDGLVDAAGEAIWP